VVRNAITQNENEMSDQINSHLRMLGYHILSLISVKRISGTEDIKVDSIYIALKQRVFKGLPQNLTPSLDRFQFD
jgi:hypothetical protein